MDIKELIKFRLLQNTDTKSLRGLLTFLVVEEVCRHLPTVCKGIVGLFTHRRKRESAAAAASAGSRDRDAERQVCSLVVEHTFGEAESDQLMDALFSTVTHAPGVTDLRYCIGRFLLDFKDPFEVSSDIYCQLLDIQQLQSNTTGASHKITLRLFSYTRSLQSIREFLSGCHAAFRAELHNKLGDSLYMFDQASATDGQQVLYNPNLHSKPQHPKTLSFTKHIFTTSRTFGNVFYDECDAVRSRVDFFLTRKDWYEAKGVPYTLGFLFHGLPGCGKTSSIKAIANIARRHIVNINMGAVKTKTQLMELFYNDELVVMTRDAMGVRDTKEVYTIPINQRLYVLEDVDCMGADLLLERPAAAAAVVAAPSMHEDEEADDDALTLSVLLNVLDGVLETPGRIIVMTTNHVDKLDKALIRPGRVDMIVEFKKASSQTIIDMYEAFYDSTWPLEGHPPNRTVTPAEVSAILFQNFGAPERAVQALLK